MRTKLMNTPGLLLDFEVLSEDGSSLALLLEEDAGTCTLTFMSLVVESLVILTDGLTWVMSTLTSLRSTDLASNWAGGGLFVSVAWSFPGLETLESTGTGGGASFGLPEVELGGVAGVAGCRHRLPLFRRGLEAELDTGCGNSKAYRLF